MFYCNLKVMTFDGVEMSGPERNFLDLNSWTSSVKRGLEFILAETWLCCTPTNAVNRGIILKRRHRAPVRQKKYIIWLETHTRLKRCSFGCPEDQKVSALLSSRNTAGKVTDCLCVVFARVWTSPLGSCDLPALFEACTSTASTGGVHLTTQILPPESCCHPSVSCATEKFRWRPKACDLSVNNHWTNPSVFLSRLGSVAAALLQPLVHRVLTLRVRRVLQPKSPWQTRK